MHSFKAIQMQSETDKLKIHMNALSFLNKVEKTTEGKTDK